MKTRHVVIAMMFLVFTHRFGFAQRSENMTLVGREGSGRSETVAIKGDTVFFNSGANLMIMDFTDPEQPDTLATFLTRGNIQKLVLFNDQVLVATESNDLLVIDVSEIRDPQLIGETNLMITDMVMSDSLLYRTGYEGETAFEIYDAADPLDIRFIGRQSFSYAPLQIAKEGDLILLGGVQGPFAFIDVSDVEQPAVIHSDTLESRLQSVALYGDYAFICGIASPEFHVYDISELPNIQEIATLDLDRAARSMHIVDQTLYIATHSSSTSAIDITDPAHPLLLDSRFLGDGHSRELAVSEHHIYVANSEAGLTVLPKKEAEPPADAQSYFPGSEAYFIKMIGDSLYTLNSGGLFNSIDISDKTHPKRVQESFVFRNADPVNMMQWEDRLILVSTHEGTKIIDPAQPDSPILEQDTPFYGWNTIAALYNDLVFVVQGNDDLYAIELLPDSLNWIPLLNTGGGSLNHMEVYQQVLYISRYDSSLQIIDCRDLDNPVLVGTLGGTERSYTCKVFSNRLYVGVGSDLNIYDLSDPINPSFLSSTDCRGTIQDIEIQDQFMVTSHGYTGVYVHDLFDPLAPTQIGYFETFDFAKQVFLDLPHVYVADSRDGVYILRNDAVVSVDNVQTASVPGIFELLPAYPNPFNSSTTLAFSLPATTKVSLSIHNLLGQTVRSWPATSYTSGRHQVHWNGRSDRGVDLSSGIYFVKMQAGAQVALRKMVLVR